MTWCGSSSDGTVGFVRNALDAEISQAIAEAIEELFGPLLAQLGFVNNFASQELRLPCAFCFGRIKCEHTLSQVSPIARGQDLVVENKFRRVTSNMSSNVGPGIPVRLDSYLADGSLMGA
jgi:hypothetical protein